MAESPAPAPARPVAAGTETLEALPVAAGRVEQDAATAGTLITGALLAELGRRLCEYEGAIEWNTSCTSCAAVLDSSIRERERAERAEAKLAEIGALCRHSAVSAWDGATPIVAAERILAITGTEGDGDRG